MARVLAAHDETRTIAWGNMQAPGWYPRANFSGWTKSAGSSLRNLSAVDKRTSFPLWVIIFVVRSSALFCRPHPAPYAFTPLPPATQNPNRRPSENFRGFHHQTMPSMLSATRSHKSSLEKQLAGKAGTQPPKEATRSLSLREKLVSVIASP